MTESVPAGDTRGKLYRLKEDDPRFGLVAGDVLRCIPYRYDPGSPVNPDGKLTVLRRESDGLDPVCNVYWYQVRLVT